MFTLLTNGDRSRLDDLNDVLRIARPDDPGLCGHPPLDARRRPALGHDSRMAAAQPSAAQRVTVEEDQTGTRGRPGPAVSAPCQAGRYEKSYPDAPFGSARRQVRG